MTARRGAQGEAGLAGSRGPPQRNLALLLPLQAAGATLCPVLANKHPSSWAVQAHGGKQGGLNRGSLCLRSRRSRPAPGAAALGPMARVGEFVLARYPCTQSVKRKHAPWVGEQGRPWEPDDAREKTEREVQPAPPFRPPHLAAFRRATSSGDHLAVPGLLLPRQLPSARALPAPRHQGSPAGTAPSRATRTIPLADPPPLAMCRPQGRALITALLAPVGCWSDSLTLQVVGLTLQVVGRISLWDGGARAGRRWRPELCARCTDIPATLLSEGPEMHWTLTPP